MARWREWKGRRVECRIGFDLRTQDLGVRDDELFRWALKAGSGRVGVWAADTEPRAD